MDELFDLLSDAITRRAVQIDVKYHPQLGYPTEFYIDYSTNISDEEFGYHVDGLTALLP